MPAWTADEIEKLKKLAEDGASRPRIAAKMGRTMTAVVAIAKQNGIQIKSPRQIRLANGLSPRWAANRE